MSDLPGTQLLPQPGTARRYRLSTASPTKKSSEARGKLGGVAGSLLAHSLIALLAAVSLTETIRGTGRGLSGTPGNGEGEAGAASLAFDVSVRDGQPDLGVPRKPETPLFGKVLPSDATEIEPVDRPETPLDPFAESADAVAKVAERFLPHESDRPAPRPPSAREILPKGLPGGSGEATEGSVTDDGAAHASRPGNGAAGLGNGSGGSGDGSLVAVYRPKPEYPLSARRRKVEGVSVIEITIDPAGIVIDAKLVETSGTESLDQAALDTARKWKYERKSSGAVLAPVTERIRFVFRLTD